MWVAGRASARVATAAVLSVVVALSSFAGARAAPRAGAAGAAGAVDPETEALTLVSVEAAERGEVLTLRSPALGAETKVRVLLPAGYADLSRPPWPLLLLLHGGGDDWRAWGDKGEVAARTVSSPFVVVMPDGGAEGWYTDNYGWGEGGPRWESYHIRELLPFLEARYRIQPGRRAVAGLSMGGHGALGYAARHPELFEAAASFSGVTDLAFLGPFSAWAVAAFELAPHYVTAGMVWGDIIGDQVRFRGRNPADLAPNLGHTALMLRWGDGREAPGRPQDVRPAIAELFLGAMNAAAVTRFHAAGLAPVVVRRTGTHVWSYWQEDLSASLPMLEAAVASDRPAPESFDYVSADPQFSAWGWDVTMTRPFLEFAELRNAGTGGFTARGTGRMYVHTAASFCPGASYRIDTTRDGAATGTEEVAGDDGRLAIDVDLGPPHPFQDWTVLAAMVRNALGDAYLERADVSIDGPSGCDAK